MCNSKGSTGHLSSNKRLKSTCGFRPKWLPPSFHTNLKHYFSSHAYDFPLAVVPFEDSRMNPLLKTSPNSWIARGGKKYRQKEKLEWRKVSSSTHKASCCTTFCQQSKQKLWGLFSAPGWRSERSHQLSVHCPECESHQVTPKTTLALHTDPLLFPSPSHPI